MANDVEVGSIIKPHGLKGELTIIPTLPGKENYQAIEKFTLSKNEILQEVELEGVKQKGDCLVLKFRGLDRIEDVEKFRGATLLADKENIDDLSEGEYYYFDLVGLKAVTAEGEELGTVTDIMETGAGHIFVIDRAGKELLVPMASELVEEIDRERGIVTLNLLEGMIE